MSWGLVSRTCSSERNRKPKRGARQACVCVRSVPQKALAPALLSHRLGLFRFAQYWCFFLFLPCVTRKHAVALASAKSTHMELLRTTSKFCGPILPHQSKQLLCKRMSSPQIITEFKPSIHANHIDTVKPTHHAPHTNNPLSLPIPTAQCDKTANRQDP